MAHYISEKIIAIDSAVGEEKTICQRECFSTILKLWEYRSCFPNNVRPFKDFEPIFHALAHIDPTKTSPSYFQNESSNDIPDEISQEIELIAKLDSAVRVVISFFIRNLILNVTTKSTLEWLEAIKGINNSDEERIIYKFLPDFEEKADDQNQRRKKELSEHIARLEAFENVSLELKAVLKSELMELNANEEH